MDENRVEGTVREYGGKFQEGVGTITGDTKTRAEGRQSQYFCFRVTVVGAKGPSGLITRRHK